MNGGWLMPRERHWAGWLLRLREFYVASTSRRSVRHVDGGDFVIVTNCEKIVVTGNKLDSVRYYRHSRYPGGLKSRTMREQLDRFPNRVLFEAVKGMMPKTRLGRAQMKKLRIYAGGEHPHQAQKPEVLEL